MKRFKANWRDQTQYPPRGCTDGDWLAWEFIRRHPDYAVHAEQMRRLEDAGEYKRIKRNSISYLDGVECWPEAQPGETAKAYFARMKQQVEQRLEKKEKKKNDGIDRPRIDRPCNSFTNKWRLEYPVAPDIEYSTKAMNFLRHEIRLKRHTSLKTKNFSLFLYPNEAAVRFRLDIPVAEQIDMAKLKLIDATRAYAKEREALAKETRALLAKHANSELPTSVLGEAHYWLRCYDADHEDKTPSGRKDARREQPSGPEARRTQFNEEHKVAGRGEIFETGKIKSFLELARDFIDNRKFLLLMTSGSRRRTRATASR